MNKIINLIIIFFVLFSCKKDKEQITPNNIKFLSKIKLDGKLYRDFIYDNENKVQKSDYYNSKGQVISYYSYEYNLKGLMIKASYFNSAPSYDSYFEYNSNNQIIKETEINNSNKLLETNIYEYNSIGQCIKWSVFNYTFSLFNKMEYSANGNLLKKYVSPELDTSGVVVDYTFDSNKAPKEYLPYDIVLFSSHNMTSVTSLNADTTGSLNINFPNTGIEIELFNSVFTYNSDGYPVKEIKTYLKKPNRIETYEYEYK